jgi:hypothetical protein
MPTYLHQILAVERTAETDAGRQLGEVVRLLGIGGDQNPLTGLTRTHEPKSDEFDKQPDQRRRVQVTTADLIAAVVESQTGYWDLSYTREVANTQAAATVMLDGEPLLENVPAGYLLFLENRLTALITGLIDKLQALDPAKEWRDHTQVPGLKRGEYAAEPMQRLSTTKAWRVLQLAPATKEHAEQTRPYEADVVTGLLTFTDYSGQLPAARIQEIRGRATKILNAVRYARQQANMLEIQQQRAGAVILGAVFGDLLPST